MEAVGDVFKLETGKFSQLEFLMETARSLWDDDNYGFILGLGYAKTVWETLRNFESITFYVWENAVQVFLT